MGALGGQLDFPLHLLTSHKEGATIPLRVNRKGRYFLSAVDFGVDASRKVRRPPVSASYSERAFPNKRPNLPSGALKVPFVKDRQYQVAPPRTFTACKAVTPGGAMDVCLPGPKKIDVKSHVNWGHAST